MFVTRRKVCILWKLEGDISVSEGEIPSEFEWWDTTWARERAAGAEAPWREYGVRLKRSNYMCLLHLECLTFAMRTPARRKVAFVDLEE